MVSIINYYCIFTYLVSEYPYFWKFRFLIRYCVDGFP